MMEFVKDKNNDDPAGAGMCLRRERKRSRAKNQQLESEFEMCRRETGDAADRRGGGTKRRIRVRERVEERRARVVLEEMDGRGPRRQPTGAWDWALKSGFCLPASSAGDWAACTGSGPIETPGGALSRLGQSATHCWCCPEPVHTNHQA